MGTNEKWRQLDYLAGSSLALLSAAGAKMIVATDGLAAVFNAAVEKRLEFEPYSFNIMSDYYSTR